MSRAPIFEPPPKTDSVAGLPREQRRSLQKLAQYALQQHRDGLDRRKARAVNWIRVKSILSNVHYFSINEYGAYIPLAPRRGVVRAIYPTLMPKYRWELGRMNANTIGATCTPTHGRGPNAFFKAQRAMLVLNSWMEEIDIDTFDDGLNQDLLVYGLCGIHRYRDAFRQNVFLQHFPAPELFPFPSCARTLEEADGLMRATIVSEAWLEAEDENYRRRNGGKNPPKLLSSLAQTQSTSMSLTSGGLANNDPHGGQMKGAIARWIWVKPTESRPTGESFFMVGDEIVRYNAGPDALDRGRIPVELTYYTKVSHDFWGRGFCEDLVAPQMEANRQYSALIKNAIDNKRFMLADGETVDTNAIMNGDCMVIRSKSPISEMKSPPLIDYPAKPVGSNVGDILNLTQSAARSASGHESGIIYGNAEGRVESGPAANLLSTNSQTPLQPVMDRKKAAYKRTFGPVLDMIQTVWPQQKRVRTSGPLNVGREILVERSGIPASQDVLIEPMPMLPNGRNMLLSLLFQLRTMQRDDGKGFEVTSREFRRSLRLLGMAPPGLELVDPAEDRILNRIAGLIGDTQQPHVEPIGSDPANDERFMLENHRMAVELFKDAILDDGWVTYGPLVRRALYDEYQFHQERLQGVHPGTFDNSILESDANAAERYLHAAEEDMETNEGVLSFNGIPVA